MKTEHCQHCGDDIPHHRHGTSPYCSDECAYEVKKLNSSERYAKIANLFDLYQRFERLLEKYYNIQELGHLVHYHHLVEEGFNFGFSTGETLTPEGHVAKTIGEYAYYLNLKTKTLSLWKLIID